MPEQGNRPKNGLIELLKYPVLVFSILVAVVLARWTLGLEFGAVTELSTGGIKFAKTTEATLDALTKLEGQVNDLTVRLQALEERPSSAAPEDQARESRQVESDASVAAQSVSDATAQIARIQRTLSSQRAIRGYIWIGDFDTSWDRTSIALPDSGQPIEMPPGRIQEGSEFRLLKNMIVRGGLPENDADYFRGRAGVGVIPKGTVVRITKAPTGIDREFAVQYWAEVEEVTDR